MIEISSLLYRVKSNALGYDQNGYSFIGLKIDNQKNSEELSIAIKK